MIKQALALAGALAVSVACSQPPTTEPLADKALGADCSLESRAFRAEMLTDLLAKTYGPGDLENLWDGLGQMQRAETEADMEAAARVYRIRLYVYLSEKTRSDLRRYTVETWERIFDDLKDRAPELAAGILAIRAEMARRCP